jgi:zona occludens toxin (predicted ATPase)
MVRRVLWLCLVCACTQDFDAFVPTDDAAVADGPNDTSTGADSGVDAPQADTGQDVTVKDVTPDIGPADVPPDVPVACTETGAVTFNNHCYFLVATTATQAAAGTNCQNTGAHLVTITTASEQAAVIALGSGTERWNDLIHQGVPVKDSNYSWATGESRNGFSAWAPGEPNGTGQCATLLATGLWNDQDCTLALASICERE